MKISIICPVYNKEPYIRQCVESVINQSFEDWELILVDDESPDNCPKICDDFAEKDSRIKVIHQKNKGHSESRNVGTRAAQGDFLMYLDSDDYLYDSSVLYEMYKYTIDNHLDVCLSQIATLKTTGELVNSTFKKLDVPYDKLNGKQVLCEMIKASCYHASMCSRLFKKKLITDNNLYFKSLICDDEEWTPQVFYYAERIGFLAKDGYVIRKLDNSVTGTKDEKTYIRKINDKLETTVLLMKTFEDFDLERAERRVLYNKFFSFANMAVHSYFNDINTHNIELKKNIRLQLKKIKKFSREIGCKNNAKLILSELLLIIK